MVELNKLKSASQWAGARKEIEAAVLDVLGPFQREHAELQVKVTDEQFHPGYLRRRINYFVEDWERVSAWLFLPEDGDDVPAILCCHQMTPHGKDEPAGIEGDRALAFARHYAELGYATIAPDCITAGERITPGRQPYDTSGFYKEHPKKSAMAKMLWDHMHALDVLAELKSVDPARIGVIGHSLGAYNALFLSAFDERVRCCVASCGFTRFADDDNPDRWVRDSGFCHIPRLKDAVAAKRFPFDWEHIIALSAPTPTLLLTALNDPTFPHTESCDVAVKQARKVYELLGAPDALRNFTHEAGHTVPYEALAEADDWFDRWL
jgi:dienelactone hydrolase